jgi:hypothetical protein
MQTGKKIKNISIVILGILFSQVIFSQENYLPGFVINSLNDTLYGLIDYRNWGSNPNKINFKDKHDNIVKTYCPKDIIEFDVQDEIYVSAIAKAQISPIKANKLQKDPIIHIQVDTIFLQTLIKGDKSLYYYKNFNDDENFYVKNENEFELLRYKKYLKYHEGFLLVIENKEFLGQLTLYLSDCSSIQSQLKKTVYNKKSLVSLFEVYYNCLKSNTTFQKKKDKITTEFGVFTGLSLSSIKFVSHASIFDYLVDADFNQSANISAGLFINFVLPRNQKKWAINNELLYTSYKVTGRYEIIRDENDYTLTTTEVGYSYLKINNLLRFKYPVGKIYLFINAGISNGLALEESNYRKDESILYGIEKVNEKKALDETRKYEQSYIVGSGAYYNKLSFEFRYEHGNGMSVYSTLNSNVRRYYFFLGYRF